MKKIMFKDKYGLTEAVVKGRKTMTRRICKDKASGAIIYAQDVDSMRLYVEDGIAEFVLKRGEIMVSVMPYKIGEVVAVAQSYKSVFEESLNYALPRYHWLDDHIDEKGYANKMFVKAGEMPHQIQITDIKVERLQDISDEDCWREGLIKGLITSGIRFKGGGLLTYLTPREAFADLIDAVSGKGTWERNPWVFAYSFELCK